MRRSEPINGAWFGTTQFPVIAVAGDVREEPACGTAMATGWQGASRDGRGTPAVPEMGSAVTEVSHVLRGVIDIEIELRRIAGMALGNGVHGAKPRGRGTTAPLGFCGTVESSRHRFVPRSRVIADTPATVMDECRWRANRRAKAAGVMSTAMRAVSITNGTVVGMRAGRCPARSQSG
jgi:hypothetical protein